MMENLEIDAGLTYLDNEPLGRVRAVALYHEHYRLITAANSPLGDRTSVGWDEVGRTGCTSMNMCEKQAKQIFEAAHRGRNHEHYEDLVGQGIPQDGPEGLGRHRSEYIGAIQLLSAL